MDDNKINHLGRALYNALRTRKTMPAITHIEPSITIDDAYQISLQMLNCRLNDGEKVIGKKIGVTSKAVQNMLGVFQPDFGFITDAMHYVNDAHIDINHHLIQPRAEAEIGFLLKESLHGPGISHTDVLRATDCIIPCFEIVDSRIDNWDIKIQDTIADNASSGVYVLGDNRIDPRKYDVDTSKIVVYKNGCYLSEGKAGQGQENPLIAVAWLANTLSHYGISLNAGEIILSGSLVPLEPVTVGDEMKMELVGAGSASVTFV